MLGIEPKTQQLIMGIVFLVMVAVFADRETGMIVK
jgi:ribose transport system permease protein